LSSYIQQERLEEIIILCFEERITCKRQAVVIKSTGR
jgi:hypothetical protein